MSEELKRPDIVVDAHLRYLDRLRERGTTNMLGAGSYLERSFFLSAGDARTVLTYWMKSFGRDDR